VGIAAARITTLVGHGAVLAALSGAFALTDLSFNLVVVLLALLAQRVYGA
jgi:hypothetical protein